MRWRGGRPWLPLLRAAGRRGLSTAPASPSAGDGRFVFLGAPGVGKGTFASLIAPAMGLRVVSVGDLVRAALQSQDQGVRLSDQARETVRSGGLLPDEAVLELVRGALPPLHGDGPGFILDGFPRTVGQAEALEALLGGEGVGGLTAVLSIELAEWVAVRKLLGRHVCSLCGRGFNTADVTTQGYDMPAIPPPAAPGQCPGRGPAEPCPVAEPGGLVRREDDTEEVVVRRLQVYRESTAPLLRFYESRGLLCRFEVRKGIKDTPALMALMMTRQQQAGGGGRHEKR